jgi:hypothetical protein
VGVDIAHLVDLGDAAAGVDEEGDAFGEVGILLVRASLRTVGSADRTIDVGEEREAELLGIGERLVVGWGIEADADDLGAGGGELWASVTEALSLPGSAAGGSLGKPPQHDPGPP